VTHRVRGLPASPGIAIGEGWVYRPLAYKVERRQSCDPQVEGARLEEALAQARTRLVELHARTLAGIGGQEAAIFEAHQLFLDDPEFKAAIQKMLEEMRINAEAAVEEAVERFAREMEGLEDEYFRARAQDIRDVGRNIIYGLLGISPSDLQLPDKPVIIVAEDLAPSDTVQFERQRILGFCTVRGGPTSHTAILARSLGVPAAVCVPLELSEVENHPSLVLDGSEGTLAIDPGPEELAQAKQAQSAWLSKFKAQILAASQAAVTRDGYAVEVVANIGSADDARQALEYGAEGVGLLRTEFLYLDRKSLPSEAEQIAVYRRIFEVMGGRPMVVRTLDIGGDKAVEYLGLRQEPNPFLGWRAIRMIGERPEVLRSQFRALLQAGREADLRIMVPMVSSLDEVRQARRLLNEARQSLLDEGLPAADKVQFGIMVEVPAAALLAEPVSEIVDFFSIGTNDLTQYTLAVDRTNERVAHLASPFHPAVIRLIAMTIEAAHAQGKWVGLCGEMAGDPLATALLLGLGLDEFSMAPTSIPAVKQAIKGLEVQACRKIAAQALELSTTQEVIEFLGKNVL
jgi:phosphoenolpyruvate-protein phosphotransferase